MAEVDKIEKMKAVAVGGPSAGAEYEAAQRSLVDTKQKALGDVAARAGAIDAPATFVNSQTARLGVPLDAAIAGLGTQAAGANAYSGALSSAQSGYMGSLQASQGLISQRLKQQSEMDYQDAYEKLAAKKKRDEREAAESANDEDKAHKQTVLDQAATSGLSPETYDTLQELAKNPNIAQAQADLRKRLASMEVVDETGKPTGMYTVDGDPTSEEVPGDEISRINSWLMTLYGFDSPQAAKAVGQYGLDSVVQSVYGQ